MREDEGKSKGKKRMGALPELRPGRKTGRTGILCQRMVGRLAQEGTTKEG